ncbi:MAG: thiamine diphosphokinase [Acidimicrobiia bacterium]|nr:thiamine diphosphokinase [Acidimicrobiia bacterium]
MSTIIVLAGGDAPRSRPPLPPSDAVIAADSGLALARWLDLEPDLVIGDMDSVDPDLLAAAHKHGVRIERHSPDKDATDLELAIDAAIDRGASAIVVVGGGGGRLDHLLANAALLSSDRYSAVSIEWYVADYHVTLVTGTQAIAGSKGDQVTLLAVGGPAIVTTIGLRWRLDDDTLEPGSTRGVSNELEADSATITVTEGRLLVLHGRTL